MNEESYATYKGFFETLKERGVEKVDLVISDGHKGIKSSQPQFRRLKLALMHGTR